jgi:predicted TPR repeat methyltransferase
MSDDRISSNAAIDGALHLDGDPRNLKQYYADWAATYNRDIGAAKYSGPQFAAALLSRHLDDKSARILDAGCGTGLVGVELQALGYSKVDGFDLSPEMAQQASATGAYGEVAGNVDMMRAPRDYPHADYDALLSIGVFTPGHVPPQALEILVQLLREGGLLVVSTRSHYFEQTDFQQCVDALLEAGRLRQLQVVWNAPYNHDGDAHYWVFTRTG